MQFCFYFILALEHAFAFTLHSCVGWLVLVPIIQRRNFCSMVASLAVFLQTHEICSLWEAIPCYGGKVLALPCCSGSQ